MKLPRYIHGFTDRTGIARHYFRRPGFPRVALPGVPWSSEFMAAYEAAVAGQPVPIAGDRPRPGSLRALAISYFQSIDFLKLKPSTKAVRRNIIERLCRQTDRDGKPLGDKSAAGLHAPHIIKLMAARASTPESANALRKSLRKLMQHAVSAGIRADDPTRDVKAIRVVTSGHHSWTEDEIEQFEARHGPGTKARLALALLLCTGQRRSDVVRMGRQHYRDGRLSVVQQKGGAQLVIPVHSELAAILAELPKDNLTYLVTNYGKPFTAAGFGNWFRDSCNEAGLRHCSAHGLRKAAGRRLAEAGCTAHEIAAILGHKTLREVERYTAAAEQARLARAAMHKMETSTGKLSDSFAKQEKKA